MAAPDMAHLAVWLYEQKVATVHKRRDRLNLTYTQQALDLYGGGTPLLSLSLPLTSETYPNAVVRSFLDGLLPEGDARRVIADDFSLLADDTYGLIRALGRDCAGALVIQPDTDSPPRAPTTKTAEQLSEDELQQLVDNLKSVPLGASQRVRISLAGAQQKLLLTKLPNGAWGRPVDGTPSTHILKPGIEGYPYTVENELFCMRLAKHLGLRVADVELITVGDRKLVTVSRYDRIIGRSGSIERLHQEDFCQATTIQPSKKYQEDGGPSLRSIAEILRLVSPEGLDTLLRATVLNVMLGNGDTHGKNFSLIHNRSGSIKLAPLYDLMSTLCYGQNRLAMYIGEVQRTDRVSGHHLVKEAESWGPPYKPRHNSNIRVDRAISRCSQRGRQRYTRSPTGATAGYRRPAEPDQILTAAGEAIPRVLRRKYA